ncbi:MAG: FG-GAP-like repeat-containing protein [Pirellulaceae bacterium]
MTSHECGVPDTARSSGAKSSSSADSGTSKNPPGFDEPSGGIPRKSRRRFYFLLVVLTLLLVTFGMRGTLFPSGRVKEDLRRGRELASAGEYTEAARLLDGYLRHFPDDHETLLYRGQVARELGDLAGARRFWQAVPDETGQVGGTARYLEATLLMEAGRGRDAIAMLSRATELSPNFLKPHERLLEIYVAQMRRADVRRELETIHQLRTWSLEELVLSVTGTQRIISIEDGIARMEQFLADDPDDVTSAMALARYYLDAERLGDAARLLEDFLARDPANSEARGLLGQVFLQQYDYGQTAATLAGVVPAAALDVWFWRSCGRYWSDQGDHAKAVECYFRVLELDPEDLPTSHRLGIALGRIGREEEARAYLDRATLIDRMLRQSIRVMQRKDDSAQNDALRLPIVVDIASLLLELGRVPDSIRWYGHALSIDQNAEVAQHGLVLALRRLGEMGGPDSGFWSTSAPPVQVAAIDAETLARLIPPRPAPDALRPQHEHVAGGATIVLRDLHEEAGLDYQYFNGQTGLKYLLESMGGGIAVLDYDNDGWPDLFLPQGCELPFDPERRTYRDRLYRNTGCGGFEDVTDFAGLGDNRYSQGCAAGDFDNDGHVDLVVANFGENLFYHNNGDGTFTDISQQIGLQGDVWSSSVALADFDRDGNLDLYIVNYVDSLKVCRNPEGEYATCDPANFNGLPDLLYHNRGDGTFQDISESAGIVQPRGNGLGVLVADLDDDGWPDIYVANDTTPNFLFHNVGASDMPRFEFSGMLSGTAVNGDGEALGSMGIACADYDANGLLDLCVTNFYGESATLYLNRGNLMFEDATRASGLFVPTKGLVGFGAQPIDFDLDGRPDLFMANGHIDDFSYRKEPWKMPPKLFKGWADGRFDDISEQLGGYFDGKYLGRAAARLDWDRDGDPDVAVVHQDAPLALLSNETQGSGGVLVLVLHGVQSNRDAIGTRVHVSCAGQVQVQEICGGDGFYVTNERRQFVGLGSAATADSVEIIWPSGARQTLQDVSANSLVVLIEGQSPLITPLARGSQ